MLLGMAWSGITNLISSTPWHPFGGIAPVCGFAANARDGRSKVHQAGGQVNCRVMSYGGELQVLLSVRVTSQRVTSSNLLD